MFVPTFIPTPEELSKLKIKDFERILKFYCDDTEIHSTAFCMMLEASVVFDLVDHQKWLRDYALDLKLEIDAEDLKSLFVTAIEKNKIRSVRCLLELVEDKNKEKVIKTHMDSIVVKDESGTVLKSLKALSMLEPSYRQWVSSSTKQWVKKALKSYIDVDIVALRNISFAMGNLFNKEGIEFSSKSKWKPIFILNNEIILYIAEFLSDGSGRYIKAVMPSIREALGINEKFIVAYDSRLNESTEIVGDDSDLESVD